MRPNLALLTECVLVGGIACSTAWSWLYATGARSLTPSAVIVCTLVTVSAFLAVEAAVKQLRRRGQPRRTHARPNKPKTRGTV